MITVEWRRAEESYIVKQDEIFIHDNANLYSALEFALAVGDTNNEFVEIISIEPESEAS